MSELAGMEGGRVPSLLFNFLLQFLLGLFFLISFNDEPVFTEKQWVGNQLWAPEDVDFGLGIMNPDCCASG